MFGVNIEGFIICYYFKITIIMMILSFILLSFYKHDRDIIKLLKDLNLYKDLLWKKVNTGILSFLGIKALGYISNNPPLSQNTHPPAVTIARNTKAIIIRNASSAYSTVMSYVTSSVKLPNKGLFWPSAEKLMVCSPSDSGASISQYPAATALFG